VGNTDLEKHERSVANVSNGNYVLCDGKGSYILYSVVL